jgi:hypothetical protein
VLSSYEVMAPTAWLHRQRAIGEARARAAGDGGPTCDQEVTEAVRNARAHHDALRALHRGR